MKNKKWTSDDYIKWIEFRERIKLTEEQKQRQIDMKHFLIDCGISWEEIISIEMQAHQTVTFLNKVYNG